MQRIVSQKPVCNTNNSSQLLCYLHLSFRCSITRKVFHSASGKKEKKKKPQVLYLLMCQSAGDILTQQLKWFSFEALLLLVLQCPIY